MISSITGSKYITVDRGDPAPTYMNTPLGALNAGQVRFNTGLQGFEVYDGVGWHTIHNNHSHLDLSHEAIAAIDWAQHKMQEEKDIKSLMEKHPGLKELYNKFEVFKTLCLEEEKENDGAC